MMGDFASRAASREATTVLLDVTLIAGIAYLFFWACLTGNDQYMTSVLVGQAASIHKA